MQIQTLIASSKIYLVTITNSCDRCLLNAKDFTWNVLLGGQQLRDAYRVLQAETLATARRAREEPNNDNERVAATCTFV